MARSQSGGLDSSHASPRPSFGRASAMRASLAETAKAVRATDRVRENAAAHFAKHRDKWIDREFRRALLTSSRTLSLTPPGMTADPKAAAHARATALVNARQAQRLNRIDRAAKSMMEGRTKLRSSRSVSWGSGRPAPAAPLRGEAKLGRVAAIQKLQQSVKQKAQTHHADNRAQWKARRFRALTKEMRLPTGTQLTENQKSLLRVARNLAERSVEAKQDRRLYLIDRACARMSEGVTPVRATRALGRGLELGR